MLDHIHHPTNFYDLRDILDTLFIMIFWKTMVDCYMAFMKMTLKIKSFTMVFWMLQFAGTLVFVGLSDVGPLFAASINLTWELGGVTVEFASFVPIPERHREVLVL